MRSRLHLIRAALATGLVVCAGAAAAQTGRVGGVIKDESDQPIKGATIRAENPDAVSSFTAVTDDKGRFSMIGLRSGIWTFKVEATGFAAEIKKMQVATVGPPNPPLNLNLKKGGGPPSTGALGGVNAKDLQGELAAADQLYNAQQWDPAIAAYRAILAKTPALTFIHLQIAAAYRNKKDYDSALASYNELLKVDPTNEKAKIQLGMTNLEKGDLQAAKKTLEEASKVPSATREVFYSLGEVYFAEGSTDGAAAAYQKALEKDPSWGKPLFKLGLVAINKGDRDSAVKYLKRIVDDPDCAAIVGADHTTTVNAGGRPTVIGSSTTGTNTTVTITDKCGDAAAAKSILEQLRK